MAIDLAINRVSADEKRLLDRAIKIVDDVQGSNVDLNLDVAGKIEAAVGLANFLGQSDIHSKGHQDLLCC